METNDMSTRMEPQPLAPLGETDTYAFSNGVIVTYGEGMMRFFADLSQPPVIVPSKLWPVIEAVGLALGLTRTEATLLAEAAEAYA